MLRAIVLICAAGVSYADCQPKSAVDVLVTPVLNANPITCFLQGQAFLAETELGRTIQPGDVVKITCVHVGDVQ